MRHGYCKGTVVIWAVDWSFLIFLNAADRESPFRLFPFPPTIIEITVVMILRVYAMWNRSKGVLCLLLFIYVPQAVVTLLVVGIYNTGTYLSGMSQINVPCYSNLTQISFHPFPPFSPVTMAHVMDFSFCKPTWSNMVFTVDVYAAIPRFILGATLLILAVTQTLKQSVTMYKATKQWQPNRYMERLMGDGILYFLAYVPVSTSLISVCNCHCVLLPLISII